MDVSNYYIWHPKIDLSLTAKSLKTVYIKPNGEFSSYIRNWAEQEGVTVEEYEVRMNEDQNADGLLLINENQDISRELYDIHTFFDKKHIPTQKIDVNGTLQVAISSTQMWLKNFKCQKVLILGSDNLVKNDNLDRFFDRIKK